MRTAPAAAGTPPPAQPPPPPPPVRANAGTYELHFIAAVPTIAAIVDGYTAFLETEGLTADSIRARTETDTAALWTAAVGAAQSGGDDRPLYWARIRMQVRLKQHPLFKADLDFLKSKPREGTPLDRILVAFEEKSRNYRGIDFSGAAAGQKKLLLTGFDPFFLDPTASGNPLQSNPSGIAALKLHGATVGQFYVQTLVVPVRYADFDRFNAGDGVVERFVGPHISTVDMVVTVSQGGDYRFDVDRFAARFRKGTKDNMLRGKGSGTDPAGLLALPAGDEFYETTLPYTDMVPAINPPGTKFKVYLNQTYIAKGAKYENEDVEGVKLVGKLSRIQRRTSAKGSGGNYLSNEIFYRVARLRWRHRRALPTGHLHVPLTQYGIRYKSGANCVTIDLNPDTGELQTKIRTILAGITLP